MKQLFLLGISLLAISACVPAARTSTASFDGYYSHAVVTAKSAPGCPDVVFPPDLIVTNGSALLQGANLTFQGYVDPNGVVAMSSTTGQILKGQIDPQFVLRAHVAGPYCAYDVTWTRTR